MSEQRLRVESGPPQHMISDDDAPPGREGDSGAKEKAQEVAGQAKEQAQQVAGQAKQHAGAAAEEARQRAATQLDERSTQLGEQVDSQAQSIDGIAEELRRQGKDGPARIAEQASEKVHDVAQRLQQADGDSIISTVTEVARENPAAAAGAGAAAGFVAGRVIKAATSDGSADEPETPGSQQGGAG
jgi:hypothetical protein